MIDRTRQHPRAEAQGVERALPVTGECRVVARRERQVEVVRLLTKLLMAARRPHWADRGPCGRWSRRTEERSQVAPAVELEFPWPHTDGDDLGHGTRPPDTGTARDPKLQGQLQAVVQLE